MKETYNHPLLAHLNVIGVNSLKIKFNVRAFYLILRVGPGALPAQVGKIAIAMKYQESGEESLLGRRGKRVSMGFFALAFPGFLLMLDL